MTLNNVETQKAGFKWFVYDFKLRRIFQQWTAPKLLKIDQDSLHTKFET